MKTSTELVAELKTALDMVAIECRRARDVMTALPDENVIDTFMRNDVAQAFAAVDRLRHVMYYGRLRACAAGARAKMKGGGH